MQIIAGINTARFFINLGPEIGLFIGESTSANFDIHDRVNYAVTEAKLKIDKDEKVIDMIVLNTSVKSDFILSIIY